MAYSRSSLNTRSVSWDEEQCLQNLSLQHFLGKILNKGVCISWLPTNHFPFRVNLIFNIKYILHNLQNFFLDNFNHSL